MLTLSADTERNESKLATNIPFNYYSIELIKKLEEFSVYYYSSSTLAMNSWNRRGEKKLLFTDLLIQFINNYWDIIFDSDSKLWRIKPLVISDINQFISEYNIQIVVMNLYEQEWIGIIKQYINQSFVSSPDVDCIYTRDYYLNQLDVFYTQFQLFYTDYNEQYSARMDKFILKYKTMKHMKLFRPILLFMNHYFYHIFSFHKISLIRGIVTRAKMFGETIQTHLNYTSNITYNEDNTQYLHLTFNTIQRTCELVCNNNHFIFVGLVLNHLFNTDIALYISEYI
jgi:hypothetical protein